MDKEQLHIIFKNKEDRNVTIKIDNPKSTIVTEDIQSVANVIIQTQAFGENLIPVRAELVTTSIEEFYLND